MKGFEVCDNFIEEDYFEHIESQMERCWWSLQEQVAYKGDVLNDKSFCSFKNRYIIFVPIK